jgi:uncharacterized protein Yka (UPF0111/DUF47 family)
MFNLLPKDEKFYDELERLSEGVVSTAGQFEAVVASFPNFDGQLRNIEQDRLIARKVYGESLLRLDQAFITPLDREDILGLINEMYGVVDRIADLFFVFSLHTFMTSCG